MTRLSKHLSVATPVSLTCFLAIAAIGEALSGVGETPADHPLVVLLDHTGAAVDPASEAAQPYSPRKTCGGCHDYERITHAYHFQMGADRLTEEGADPAAPWSLSDGMVGRQIHMSYQWLAPKRASVPEALELTTYKFAATCGVCHPGGGLLERDRSGKRFDEQQRSRPSLASELDGDYFGAVWDRSGVIEADCLLCHQADYDYGARKAQLTKGNFRWAATAGSGLADIEGAVADGETPTVRYRPGVFQNGAVRPRIGKTTDRNCLFCHGEAEVKKRGHVWDGRNEDVHSSRGLGCTSCHVTKADHQVAKGDSSEVFLRQDLDDPDLSCGGCHNKGTRGAPRPEHSELPASHLAKIACVTCHVRASGVTAVLAVDTTSGKAVGIATAKDAKTYGESRDWTPALFRLPDGKVYAGNLLLPVWWGNHVGDAIHPLTLSETARAYESVRADIRDDTGDGKPEANTDAEITSMLKALSRSLQGSRFKVARPVYVKGHLVYELDEGRLRTFAHAQAAPLRWTFSHNVGPANRALGSGGCSDCHGEKAAFFRSPVVSDPFDGEGKPVTTPAWRYLGLKESVISASR